MGQELTLVIPDRIFQTLNQEAQATGQTVEAVVNAYLARTVEAASPHPGGRLRDWAGAFRSGVADSGLHHDDYLGDALLDESRGGPGA